MAISIQFRSFFHLGLPSPLFGSTDRSLLLLSPGSFPHGPHPPSEQTSSLIDSAKVEVTRNVCSRSSRRDLPTLIILTLHHCSAFPLLSYVFQRTNWRLYRGRGKGRGEIKGRREEVGSGRENKKLSHIIIEAVRPPFIVGEL